jgi:DNA-binding Lrp family transcriptional regulator
LPVAFVLLNVELGSEDEILKDLQRVKEIKESYRVYGVYDTIVKVEADSVEGLKNVTSMIRKIPKVRSTLTMISIS